MTTSRTNERTALSTPLSGAALIVDDHPLFRDALQSLLSVILGDHSVFAASSAEEGLRLVATRTNFCLVLLDVVLPGLSGIEAIASFRRACPSATLVVVSASEDRRDVEAAFRVGAHAFVSKSVPTEVLVDAVRRILAGERPEHGWIRSSEGIKFQETSSQPPLTSRQHEILSLLCRGHSNKEIGLRLSLSEVTVKRHVSSIFRVLGVTNRTQAVLTARRLALFETDQAD